MGGNGGNKTQGGNKGQLSTFVVNSSANLENQYNAWVLDNGKSHHIINDISNLLNVITYTRLDGVMICNEGILHITHIGISSLPTTISHIHLTLHNVLHTLSITT